MASIKSLVLITNFSLTYAKVVLGTDARSEAHHIGSIFHSALPFFRGLSQEIGCFWVLEFQKKPEAMAQEVLSNASLLTSISKANHHRFPSL
jgi:hypothetical protein